MQLGVRHRYDGVTHSSVEDLTGHLATLLGVGLGENQVLGLKPIDA